MLPSEATIENLCNHSIMSGLRENGMSSILLKPTSHQEKELGFDGMIRSAGGSYQAAVYIQYKRLIGPTANGEWVILAKQEQQKTLARFSTWIEPDDGVFYAFSKAQTNKDLGAVAHWDEFLDTMVFVRAADISVGEQKTKRHRYFQAAAGGHSFAGSRESRRKPSQVTDIPAWTGREWLDRLLNQKFGMLIRVTDESRLRRTQHISPSELDVGFDSVSGSLLLCRPTHD